MIRCLGDSLSLTEQRGCPSNVPQDSSCRYCVAFLVTLPNVRLQFEAISALPRSKQRMLLDMINAALNSTAAQAA